MANARPSWTGTLKIGTIVIPVQLVPASGEEDSPFVTVHAVDDGRLETVKRCKGCARDVEAAECVQAVEAGKGIYSRVTADELAALATPNRNNGVVELDYFRPAERGPIPPQLYEKPYHVVPDPAYDGHPGYDLLLAALLAKRYTAATGKIAFRSREWIAAVYCQDYSLMLSTLRMPAEIREAPPVPFPDVPAAHVNDLLAVFGAINAKHPGRTLDDYHDEYSDRLRALVTRKKAGKVALATSTDVLAEQLRTTAQRARRSSSRKAA